VKTAETLAEQRALEAEARLTEAFRAVMESPAGRLVMSTILRAEAYGRYGRCNWASDASLRDFLGGQAQVGLSLAEYLMTQHTRSWALMEAERVESIVHEAARAVPPQPPQPENPDA
jgi:hypothetical protein